MKKVLSQSRTALVALAALLAAVATAGAQTLANPSFEADVFTVAPGSISANTAITGWSATDNAKAGLSPAGALNTFANNGVIPSGTNVLFIQPTNTLSTTITGLEVGSNYLLRFRANSQSNQRGSLRLGLDGGPMFEAGSVAAVGGTLPYQYVAVPFTATAASHTLSISNNTTLAGLTNVLLVDDFSVSLNTSAWSFNIWTNDASSGVDSSKNYTHAYAFGVSGVPFAINGVPFTRISGANPQVAHELQTANLGSTTTDAANVLKTAAGGSSSNLAHGFVYGGNPEIFTFENLVPGVDYVATFYSVGWDPRTYGRSATWMTGGDRLSMNEDHFGDGVGIRISHRYTAPASGYFSISNFPFSTAVGTLHIFGAANYEVAPQAAPLIGVQPVSKASIPGGGAGFYTTAGGTRPLSYRWMKDGAEIASQTNRTLILSNLAGGDLAGYSVSVSNASGTVVTSLVATLSFSTATIPNPSFEEDTFLNSPGYISGNFPIAGWLSSNPAKTGINPAADVLNPFGNTGTIPDGRNAAFIQGAGVTSLRTTITNLTPGSNYTVQFRSNGRNQSNARALLKISVDDTTLVDTTHNAVGGTNAYRYVAFDFTANSNSAVLGLTNDTPTDFTVNVDNFTIAPSTSKWTYALWTNDATAGIDTSKFYTHAFHFGPAATDTILNGVTFRGAPGVNPSVPGAFSMSGFGSAYPGDVNNLTTNGGGSGVLASSFIYGGPVQTINLSNLVPGAEYVVSIYAVAFDVKGYGRSATFNFNGDLKTINLDHFGLDNGIVISHPYTAPSNGTVSISYTPTDSASSFHTYALANRVANDSAPVIGAQPLDAFVALGSMANFSIGLSAGSLPLSYQWQLNGADILDATNATLSASNLNAHGSAQYQVIITNFLGAVTSVVANLEVGAPISELFNTGVDSTGAMLSGGAVGSLVDPHYQMTTSADTNYPGPAAVTLANGVYPVVPGTYLPNPPGSLSTWIAPSTNVAALAVGTYVYRTTFIMATTDTNRAQISGRWASDNGGVDIRLNGLGTGISNNDARPFGNLFPFTITNGFVAGSNVLEFVIANLAPAGPTALRVEMTGVARPMSNAAPVIVASPTDRTVVEGTEVVFAVMASGSGPLSYQWFYEGFDLIDETNRTLRFPSVTSGDHVGHYYCTVGNSEGSTNSTEALLTVLIPTTLIDPPVGQNVECTSNATFSVTAGGTGPFAYQWIFGSSPAVDETNSTLLALDVHGIAEVRVIVTGAANSVTSAPVHLTATDTIAPVLTCPGDIIVFTSSNSRPVNFSFTATDGCDTNITAWSSLSSGSEFPLGTNTVLVVASDSGYNTNTCSFTITVLAVTPPTAGGSSLSGTNASFSFPTQDGLSYRVESTDSLTPAAWTLFLTITGDGTVKSVTDTNAVVPMRFYRILVE